MTLDKNQLDLFFAFTARHKRFLKLRETSFNAKQIDFGVKISEKAVKAVQATCKSLSCSFQECFDKPATRGKLLREMKKKATRLIPKQAAFILENFDSFQTAVQIHFQPAGPKAAKKPAEFGDRFYQPVEHNYR